MDDTLPTYESAVARDPWRVIGPYVYIEDLYSTCLVSRDFNRRFSPLLWGEPASKFALGERAALNGFLRLCKSIHVARSEILLLTHTLDLTSVLTSIYTRLPATWLRDVFSKLGSLRQLFISHFSFFDHQALLYLGASLHRPSDVAPFPLRILDASYCSNSTAGGLYRALPTFKNILCLDLSSTNGANHREILQIISSSTILPNLQILRLRSLRLDDTDIGIIASGIGTRVWSLDVSGNLITDRSVENLLDYCFLPPEYRSSNSYGNGLNDGDDGTFGAPPPSFRDIVGARVNEGTGIEDDDAEIREFYGRLEVSHDESSIANPRRGGLTNLGISGCLLTVDGIGKLLKSTNIQKLNCGNLRMPKSARRGSGLSFDGSAPGIESLVPSLSQYAYRKLTFLRIDHRIVTGSSALTDPFAQGPSLLAPSMLPHLRTLILTGVPARTKKAWVPENLRRFIEQLADQERETARIEAEAGTFMEVPPLGRRRGVRDSRQDVSPSGLQTLQLELVENETEEGMNPGLQGPLSPTALNTKSFTGDEDGEWLAQVASGDYSFFSAEEGEGGEWYSDPRKSLDAQSKSSSRRYSSSIRSTSSNLSPLLDVFTILASFRKERRAVHDTLTDAGHGGPGAGGHWSGTVKILRDLSQGGGAVAEPALTESPIGPGDGVDEA